MQVVDGGDVAMEHPSHGSDATLRCLTGLTALQLSLSSVPASLPRLPRLQRLCYPHCDAPLPPGPYSTSLRVLGANFDCLNSSSALLASCSVLQHVAILGGNCEDSGPLWEWAQQHPSLQRLQICPLLTEAQVITDLLTARPQLRVFSIDDEAEPLFEWHDEFWAKSEDNFWAKSEDNLPCVFSCVF